MEGAPVSRPFDAVPALSYLEQRRIIQDDLLAKYLREDWHGVMDCAADLRELDAYQRGLRK
jgi:hypothetical protein